jgi:hypothetical protein
MHIPGNNGNLPLNPSVSPYLTPRSICSPPPISSPATPRRATSRADLHPPPQRPGAAHPRWRSHPPFPGRGQPSAADRGDAPHYRPCSCPSVPQVAARPRPATAVCLRPFSPTSAQRRWCAEPSRRSQPPLPARDGGGAQSRLGARAVAQAPTDPAPMPFLCRLSPRRRPSSRGRRPSPYGLPSPPLVRTRPALRSQAAPAQAPLVPAQAALPAQAPW